MVLVAEKIFKLHTEEEIAAVREERSGVAAVQMISSKKTCQQLDRRDAQQGEKRQVVVRRIFANHCAAGDVVETVRASPRHQNHCCLGCCRVCSRIPSA